MSKLGSSGIRQLSGGVIKKGKKDGHAKGQSMHRPGDIQVRERLREMILQLLQARAEGSSCCPSEVSIETKK